MEIKYNTIFPEVPIRQVYLLKNLSAISRMQTTTPPILPENLKLVTLINMDGKHPALVVEE